jgi:hypothetical protein
MTDQAEDKKAPFVSDDGTEFRLDEACERGFIDSAVIAFKDPMTGLFHVYSISHVATEKNTEDATKVIGQVVALMQPVLDNTMPDDEMEGLLRASQRARENGEPS